MGGLSALCGRSVSIVWAVFQHCVGGLSAPCGQSSALCERSVSIVCGAFQHHVSCLSALCACMCRASIQAHTPAAVWLQLFIKVELLLAQEGMSALL